MTKNLTSDSSNDTSIELLYCIKHNFGAVSSNSQRQKEHIDLSETKCKFVKYNPKKHNPKYDNSEIKPYDDSEEKLTPTQKVLNFAESKIIRTVRSFNSNSSVYGVIKINEHYRVLFLGSTECRQWLLSEYRKYSGKVHGKDLYKSVLSAIIAESITNQIPIEKINNRICFVNDEIFYNLCNDDYEIVKKPKSNKNTKRYSHFKCLTCGAGEFKITSKKILQYHTKLGHSINYFNFKEDDKQ